MESRIQRSKVTTQYAAPDTGSAGDVTALLTKITELLRKAQWSSVLLSIADEAARDPRVAEIHSGIQKGHMAPCHQVTQSDA